MASLIFRFSGGLLLQRFTLEMLCKDLKKTLPPDDCRAVLPTVKQSSDKPSSEA
jgi:hypothetical protein